MVAAQTSWITLVGIMILLTTYGMCQDLPHIEDELVLETVRNYISMCPYNDLCYYESNHAIPTSASYDMDTPVSCCSLCFCERCGTSCCPDKPTSYLTNEDIRNIRESSLQCRRMQYKEVDEINGILKNHAYLTVSDCPPGYDDTAIKRKCVKPNHEFDFQDGFSEFVPVTSNVSIFKNKYCAICNGADMQNVDFWKTEIYCEFSTDSNIPANGLSKLQRTIDSNDDCDLFFSAVNITSIVMENSCKRLIDRCNVSGNWLQYDAGMERACMSYKSVYYNFKNVHCYLCNKGPDEKVQDICEAEFIGYDPNAFVALIDFGNLRDNSKATPMPSAKCTDEYEYDWIQGECRLLICPEYMFLLDGECRALVQSVTGYDVIVKVELRDFIKHLYFLPGSIEILFSSLASVVSDLLRTTQSKFLLCELLGYVSLNKTLLELVDNLRSNTIEYLEHSEFEYFAFRFQLLGQLDMNLTQELLNLEALFHNYSHISGLSPYIIRFQEIPLEIFANASRAYTDYEWFGNPSQERLLDSVKLDKTLHKALAASYVSSLDGHTHAPLNPYTTNECEPVAKYQVKPFCPKIELFTDEFSVNEDGIMIIIDNAKLFLPNHEIVLTQNNSVYVCYKTYMSWINNIRSPEQNVNELKPIMIVTIICISMSLISLIITFIVYVIFSQLRTLPGLNLMALVCCLFFTHLLTLINGVVKIKLNELCVAFGIVLHFVLLLSIFWMFVCTFHMAKVFTHLMEMRQQNLNNCRAFTRYIGFTIVMSVLLVVTNIAVSFVRSDNTSIGYDDVVCYLDSSLMVLLTVAVPVGLVVLANIGMFICVIVKVGRIPVMDTHRRNERNNIAIFAKLSTITGITWIFGFLYQFTNIEVLSYIFVVLNASQGIFIMVAFVINRRVLEMLKVRYLDHTTTNSTNNTDLNKTNNKTGKNHSNELQSQTKL